MQYIEIVFIRVGIQGSHLIPTPLLFHRFHTPPHLNKQQHIRHNTNWQSPVSPHHRFPTLQHCNCRTRRIHIQRPPIQMRRHPWRPLPCNKVKSSHTLPEQRTALCWRQLNCNSCNSSTSSHLARRRQLPHRIITFLPLIQLQHRFYPNSVQRWWHQPRPPIIRQHLPVRHINSSHLSVSAIAFVRIHEYIHFFFLLLFLSLARSFSNSRCPAVPILECTKTSCITRIPSAANASV